MTLGEFNELTSRDDLTLVDFYAVWCGKCAMMKPLVEEIEKKYRKKIRFCEVDIDESPLLTADYEADIVPTFVFFPEWPIPWQYAGNHRRECI